MNTVKIFILVFLQAFVTVHLKAQNHATCTSGHYNIEVTTEKTTHLSFPQRILSVDLGAEYIIAQKADGADNILRIKAAEVDFPDETNFSVICADGSFYMFNVIYSKEPSCLYYEMNEMRATNGEIPTNHFEIATSELRGESPTVADMISKSILLRDRRQIKHIGIREQRVECLLKGIYSYNSKMYFHISITNRSGIAYTIENLTFKVSDRKVLKKTVSQDLYMKPVRVHNQATIIPARKTCSQVFVFDKFTLAPDKVMWMEIFEAGGGRNLKVKLRAEDLLLAKEISKIEVK